MDRLDVMADKTVHTRELTRSDIAAELRTLADEFENSEQVNVSVGNKIVELLPPETVDFEMRVEEKGSIIGGKKERITITMGWKKQ